MASLSATTMDQLFSWEASTTTPTPDNLFSSPITGNGDLVSTQRPNSLSSQIHQNNALSNHTDQYDNFPSTETSQYDNSFASQNVEIPSSQSTDNLVSSETWQTQQTLTFEKDNLFSKQSKLNPFPHSKSLLITTNQQAVTTINIDNSSDNNSELFSDTSNLG
jgi:hypothetical protein